MFFKKKNDYMSPFINKSVCAFRCKQISIIIEEKEMKYLVKTMVLISMLLVSIGCSGIGERKYTKSRPDFGKVYWGMSKNEIVKMEQKQPVGKGMVGNHKERVSYNKTIKGHQCRIDYIFYNNQLVNLGVFFPSSNLKQTTKIKKSILKYVKKIYHVPFRKIKRTFEHYNWETRRSRINFTIKNNYILLTLIGRWVEYYKS